jgi:tetratricopeptide (TPR) repeat protein
MDSRVDTPEAQVAGRAWLDSLPAAEAKGAAAALAALPVDASAAGPALPLVIAAWTLVDPARAADLLEAWLATADAAGNLTPPCPVVCQWAERIAHALPDDTAFRARILPQLARCFTREFDRYDVNGVALPLWPSAAEALFPAEYAPERFTVDLAVLLSNEAESFCRLAQDREAEYAKVLDNAEGEQRELDVWLKESFWDAEESTFHCYEAGGACKRDGSPCGFIPLAWGGRTLEMAEGLRVRVGNWDPGVWPARAWVLFFALLLRTPHNTVVARMRRDGLPAGATPAEAAAWGVLSAGADRARAAYIGDVPGAVRWLDAHGRGLARAGLAGAGVLLAVLLGWGVFQRGRPAAEGLEELERQARQASAEGRHAQAAALFGRAAGLGRAAYFRYRQAGEWMRLGHVEAAETAYRGLLAEEPGSPNVRLNLALAVWQQGRREDALSLYRAFAEDPEAAAYPDLAGRARLAAELIERQIALDRQD